MLKVTSDVMMASLKADPTVDPADRIRIITAAQTAANPGVSPKEHGLCVVRRGMVASMLSVSLRTVDKLHSQGILKKVRFPGRGRAAGFLLGDVEALIGGVHE